MDKISKIKKKKNGSNSRWQLHIWGHPNIQGGVQTYGGIQDGGYTYGVSKHIGCIQTCRGHPNIWVVSKCMGASNHIRGIQTWGHPNIQGGVQTYGGIQTYRGHPNIQGVHQNIGGHPNIQGVSKHKGGIQTYGWCPNIWEHQNIQGASKHCRRLKSIASSATHMGATKHTGGIQTYSRASKHMGASKYMGGVQT